MEQQRKQLKRNRYWSEEEDEKLLREVCMKPKQNWYSVARNAGLNRSGNSCRLRWINHLKPVHRPGKLTVEEKLLILELRSRLGKNCWTKIATHLLPGRRDNDIKNFWHTMAKRAKLDVDSEAVVKKAELVEKITAAGKLTMDYSLSISSDAYTILKTLLPGLAAAEGSSVAASSLTAADIGVADDLISAHLGPTMEVRYEFPKSLCGSHILPEDVLVQQRMMGTAQGDHQIEGLDWFSDYGGDQGTAVGFDQEVAAPWGTSNDTGNSQNSNAQQK